ncbi:hypothetical protein TNCV_3739921 [Trichonephila clavipes]|nr:hypothetical protein TNCV_3739921 [Trichonephila clavipes]
MLVSLTDSSRTLGDAPHSLRNAAVPSCTILYSRPYNMPVLSSVSGGKLLSSMSLSVPLLSPSISYSYDNHWFQSNQNPQLCNFQFRTELK